eukprot:TRINITY_DN9785_c0_g2_i1.p1 TRINITY_DN9785_c0_g2~~TRINITY_DN9785_c0_g2_i1.p1  ORF type:complete len:1049 (-),score=175.62 TRINITY_DN9785_c0_g2_i1:382-3528(-)
MIFDEVIPTGNTEERDMDGSPTSPDDEKQKLAGDNKSSRSAANLEAPIWARYLANHWVEMPFSTCSACALAMFFASVVSIATGCMEMHIDVDGAWSVVEADDTSWLITYNQAAGMASGRERRLLSSEGFEDDERDALEAFKRWRRLDDHGNGTGEEHEEDIPFPKDWAEGFRPYFMIHYKTQEGNNVFEAKQLQDMCRFEKPIATSAAFQDYCLRTSPSVDSCWNLVMSPLGMFYGTPESGFTLRGYDWSCVELSSSFVETRNAMLWQQLQQEKSAAAWFVSASTKSQGAPLRSKVSRSMYVLGTPTADGESVNEDTINDAEISKVEEALFKLPDEDMAYGPGGIATSAYQVDEDRFTRVGSIRVRFNVPFRNDFLMIQTDFIFCFCSIVFVFCYLYFYLDSCFMASVGMFQIIMSLPMAGLLYQGIFQVKYFSFIQILTVFLALGIGADNIFVMTDAFRQTAYVMPPAGEGGQYTKEQLKQRLAYAYARSVHAVLNTSGTTAMAFLSSSGSKVMPMRTNGWYATLVIVLLLVGVVTLTPPVLIIHAERLLGKRCCCPWWSAGAEGRRQVTLKPEPTFTERFIEKYYVQAMKFEYKGVRVVALFVFLTTVVVAIQGFAFTFQLTPPLQPEEWYPSNHMDTSIMSYVKSAYLGQGDDVAYAGMTLVWGLSGIDRRDFNPYRPYDQPGTPTFDSKFDLSRKDAQDHILETCTELRSLACTAAGCSGGKFLAPMADSVACPLEEFKEWLSTEKSMATLPTGDQFTQLLQEYRGQAELSEDKQENAGADYWRQIGFINGRLKYFSVALRSSMLQDEALGKGSDVRSVIKDFVEKRNGAAPAAATGLVVVSNRFASYDLQEELIMGLFTGLGIAFPIAFFVLLYATGNLILAIYSILAVGSIVASVLGWCKSAQGWDLGVGESVAGVIVIGYSVDYVVHLAHIYEESSKQGAVTREDRATFAVVNMGSTVFAGAITTAGSGLCMLLCFSTFFDKMAKLMTMTIVYSFLFSLGGLMSACYLMGPEGETGSLRHMWNAAPCRKINQSPVTPLDKE